MTRLGESSAVREIRDLLRQERGRALLERDSLEKDLTGATATIEWWTADPHPYEPWANEIAGLPRALQLSCRPRLGDGAVEVVLDTERRVLATRRWQTDVMHDDTYYRSSERSVKAWTFVSGRRAAERLESVSQIELGEHGPLLVVHCGTGPNFSAYEYRWTAAGRVESVRVDSAGWPSDVTYQLSYAADGELDRIVEGGFVVFARPTRSRAELERALRTKLLVRVPEAVRQNRPVEPCYCLALGFNADSPSEMLPPQLGLGLASNRQIFMTRTRGGTSSPDLDSVWNPSLFVDAPTPSPFPLEGWEADDLVAESQEYAAHLLQEESTARAQKLLVAVARELNRLDWSVWMPVTDDFVVYPVDFEAGSWREYMEVSVPKAKLRLLRARGLLGP